MNINKKQTLIILALLTMTHVTVAQAKDKAVVSEKDPVVITLTLKRIVTDAKGQETREDAPKIKPGDVLEYSAVYRNRGKQAVTGVKALLPIPKGLVYVKQSAKPLPVEATADGVKYAAEPLMRTEKDQTGKEQQVEVPYVEYRSLRCDVGELSAGKKVEVSARMKAGELPKSPEELVAKPATPLAK